LIALIAAKEGCTMRLVILGCLAILRLRARNESGDCQQSPRCDAPRGEYPTLLERSAEESCDALLAAAEPTSTRRTGFTSAGKHWLNRTPPFAQILRVGTRSVKLQARSELLPVSAAHVHLFTQSAR